MKKINIRYKNRLIAKGLEKIIDSTEGLSVNNILQINYSTAAPDIFQKVVELTILELDYPNKIDTGFLYNALSAASISPIMLISNEASAQISSELIKTGISGYLLKSCDESDLLKGIYKILEGKNYYCSCITRKILIENNNHDSFGQEELTEREREVLKLFAINSSIIDIANILHISESTVKTHKKNILSKLGMHNTLDLFLYAVRNELVEAGDHDLCIHCPYFSSN